MEQNTVQHSNRYAYNLLISWWSPFFFYHFRNHFLQMADVSANLWSQSSPKPSNTRLEFCYSTWFLFTPQVLLKWPPYEFYRIKVWTGCRSAPPFDSFLFKVLLSPSTGVLGVVVLLKSVVVGIVGVKERYQSSLQDFCVSCCDQSSSEHHEGSSSSCWYASPHVDFWWMLWFGTKWCWLFFR